MAGIAKHWILTLSSLHTWPCAICDKQGICSSLIWPLQVTSDPVLNYSSLSTCISADSIWIVIGYCSVHSGIKLFTAQEQVCAFSLKFMNLILFFPVDIGKHLSERVPCVFSLWPSVLVLTKWLHNPNNRILWEKKKEKDTQKSCGWHAPLWSK